MRKHKHEIPILDNHGLKQFGLTTAAIIAVLFGAVAPWLFGRDYPYWPWLVAGLFMLWAIVSPASLGPVYSAWMRFGLLMGRVITPLILGVVFFLLISPVGLIRRAFGKDNVDRKLDSDADSYRVKSRKADRRNLEDPF